MVVYRQVGYIDRAYELVVNGATTNDADLFKRDTNAAYWAEAAQVIKMEATRQNNGMDAYTKAWLQIDASGLSPEAKAEAAKQIFNVLPVPNQAPQTLLAYKVTDPSKMLDSAKFIDQALLSTNKLNFVNLPAPVAADIAATQVTRFEKTNNTKVPTRFFVDFNDKYGNEASERLKTEVKQIEAAEPAANRPM